MSIFISPGTHRAQNTLEQIPNGREHVKKFLKERELDKLAEKNVQGILTAIHNESSSVHKFAELLDNRDVLKSFLTAVNIQANSIGTSKQGLFYKLIFKNADNRSKVTDLEGRKLLKRKIRAFLLAKKDTDIEDDAKDESEKIDPNDKSSKRKKHTDIFAKLSGGRRSDVLKVFMVLVLWEYIRIQESKAKAAEDAAETERKRKEYEAKSAAEAERKLKEKEKEREEDARRSQEDFDKFLQESREAWRKKQDEADRKEREKQDAFDRRMHELMQKTQQDSKALQDELNEIKANRQAMIEWREKRGEHTRIRDEIWQLLDTRRHAKDEYLDTVAQNLKSKIEELKTVEEALRAQAEGKKDKAEKLKEIKELEDARNSLEKSIHLAQDTTQEKKQIIEAWIEKEKQHIIEYFGTSGVLDIEKYFKSANSNYEYIQSETTDHPKVEFKGKTRFPEVPEDKKQHVLKVLDDTVKKNLPIMIRTFMEQEKVSEKTKTIDELLSHKSDDPNEIERDLAVPKIMLKEILEKTVQIDSLKKLTEKLGIYDEILGYLKPVRDAIDKATSAVEEAKAAKEKKRKDLLATYLASKKEQVEDIWKGFFDPNDPRYKDPSKFCADLGLKTSYGVDKDIIIKIRNSKNNHVEKLFSMLCNVAKREGELSFFVTHFFDVITSYETFKNPPWNTGRYGDVEHLYPYYFYPDESKTLKQIFCSCYRIIHNKYDIFQSTPHISKDEIKKALDSLKTNRDELIQEIAKCFEQRVFKKIP